ncbi:O-succinylhomoserine sulfhydrylase [Neisseria sp. Ec49-e6-T10]|uniref:O-succinylhomoserine sulfhydrylase n=1 Tax=Neisseria sp. Ec49-e6-T10 TaxID=3140744 RepID=UPI003EC13EED
MSQDKQYHPQTLAIRGARQISQFHEHSQSLFLSSSFMFESAQAGAALFAGEAEGYTYSRTANPTVTAFQDRMAQLEGAQAGIATATGMAAIQATILTFLKAGEHIVASQSLFGTTLGLLNGQMPKLGIDVTFVAPSDLSAWENAIQDNTRLLYLETPSNPLTEMADIRALSQLAKSKNVLLVVDNCFCTPAVQQPIKLGADLTVNSATKGIDGQGRVMGGVVCGSKELIEQVFMHVRTAGQTLSAFNAWVLMSGLETLFVRTEKQNDNALALAKWLEQHPKVQRVYYPGLPSHPQHELAKVQQNGFGSVLSFEVKGDRAQAWHVVDQVCLFSKTANVGDVKSTITHPYTTTHARVTPEDKAKAGIKESLLRLSIGLEHIDDLKNDLAQALS